MNDGWTLVWPFLIGRTEHVILDDQHPNGVHKRVYEEMETVKDIYEHPGKYKDVL